jgi:tetratricopeptide (TPR) repeat protein
VVWNAAGGHPLLLRMLTRSLELAAASRQPETTGHVLPVFAAAYAALESSERLALYAFLLLPPGEVLVTDVLDIWYGMIAPDDINGLLRRSLLVTRSLEVGLLELPQAIRTFLSVRLSESPEPLERIRHLVTRLDRRLREQHPQAEQVAEHLLRSNTLELPSALRHDWLLRLTETALAEDRITGWRNVLQAEVTQLDAPNALRFVYGVCLRRLALWDEAAGLLHQVVQDAGRSGDFELQVNALVELATLERSQGRYEAAQQRLQHAERMCARMQMADTLNRIRLEQAQIAIDVGLAEEAEMLLLHLPDSLRVVALRAEARLLRGDVEGAERLLSRAYDFLPPGDYNTEARLRTLLARTYERAGELRSAQEHFAAALTRLEQSDDPFALNRARTNLAAVLVSMNALDDATSLLRAAEAEQVLIGDAVGLTATRHNAQILRLRRTRPHNE